LVYKYKNKSFKIKIINYWKYL